METQHQLLPSLNHPTGTNLRLGATNLNKQTLYAFFLYPLHTIFTPKILKIRRYHIFDVPKVRMHKGDWEIITVK